MVNNEGIAWFWMSEGHANLAIRKHGKGGIEYLLWAELRFTNSDEKLLKALEKWLETKQIKYHRHNNVSSAIKPVHEIHICGYSVKEFLDIVHPNLLGEKKKIADLLLIYFKEVWLPSGTSMTYGKFSRRRRFLRGVRIHDAICDIVGPRYNRKYTLHFFLHKFGISDTSLYKLNSRLFVTPRKEKPK